MLLHLYDPDNKQQSAVWKRPRSPVPREGASVQVQREIYVNCFFCDRKGMLLQHAVAKNTTVNAAYYSKVNLIGV